MSYLTLNGLTLNVGASEASITEVGDRARAFDGSARSTMIAQKREWKLNTLQLSASDADFWSAVIRGQGDLFDLQSTTWSSKGAAITGTAPTYGAASSGYYVGDVYAQFSPSAGITFTQVLPTIPGSSQAGCWSILWWQQNPGSTSFSHFAATFDGSITAYYQNGSPLSLGGLSIGNQYPALTATSAPAIQCPFKITSLLTRANSTAYTLNQTVEPATPNSYLYRVTTAGTSAGSPPTFGTTVGGTTTDGSVVWTCLGLKTPRLDQIVVVPAVISQSMVAALVGAGTAVTNRWAPTPRLYMGGDIANSRNITVEGMVGSDRLTPFWDTAGVRQAAGRSLEFTLAEV